MNTQELLDKLTKEQKLEIVSKLLYNDDFKLSQCDLCHKIDSDNINLDNCVDAGYIIKDGNTYPLRCPFCKNSIPRCCVEMFVYPINHFTEISEDTCREWYWDEEVYVTKCFRCLCTANIKSGKK